MNIPWLEPHMPLPAPETAQKIGSPLAGLVAAGGGLSVSRLCEAYQEGIFPWFNEGQPVLWWSPDPRMVLHTQDFKLHRSLKKVLKTFIASPSCEVRIDHAFKQVIEHCAQTPRRGQPGTWIVGDMIEAYIALHTAGFAHSVETWVNGQLVGGLYCVSIGDTLFGESMFALQTDASKIALAALVAFARSQGLMWIDCQQNTHHLASLGAREMQRSEFIQLIRQAPKHTRRTWVFTDAIWDHLLTSKDAH
jgi:leucyl/phenylalanyl-tRNA--protein transferase